MMVRPTHIRGLERNDRRADFRSRQLVLAVTASCHLALFVLTSKAIFAAVAVLVIQTGSIEAMRFRRSGRWYQTMRSIQRGSTYWDARLRERLRRHSR